MQIPIRSLAQILPGSSSETRTTPGTQSSAGFRADVAYRGGRAHAARHGATPGTVRQMLRVQKILHGCILVQVALAFSCLKAGALGH